MGKVGSIIQKSRSILLLFTILLWQSIFALAPVLQNNIANAATLSSTDVGFTSVGFVLSGNYSVVSGQPTGTGQLKNGNVGGYPEGACIPAQFNVTNKSNTAGDTVISPIYDYYNNGVIGISNYEKITTSLTGDPSASADNLNDFSFTGQPLSSATSFTTSAGGTVSASITGPYSNNDAGTSATTATDAFRHYNISLTNIPAHTTVYILLCGRLGLDASQYPGSSLSLRTVQGGAENVPIPVNQILSLPSITITKTVTQGTALPSDFSFNLSADPHNGLGTHYTIASGQNSVTIPNVNPDGTYTITESGPAGYTFTGGTGTNCTAVGATIGTAAGQMSASVAAGTTGQNPSIVNATCNFTNTVQTGSITITKDAIPNSSQDFAFTTTGSGVSNFSLDDDSDPTLSNTKTFTGLLPGTYSFTEGAVSGWDFDSISGCSGTGIVKNGSTVTITLGAGQNVSCTYTNRQRGHIVVHKTTNPANDPTGFSITASGTGSIAGNATQTLTTSQDVTYDVAQGTYAVSEDLTSTPGWHMDSNTCSNLVINGNTPLVNGVPTLTCTITNTKLAKLKIIKSTNPASSSQTFSFGSTGPSIDQSNSTFILDTNGADNTYPNNYQYVNLTPGTYGVTETEPNGWQLTGLVCSGATYTWPGNTQTLSLNLAAGADVTCTYTNTQLGSISGFKFESNADSSTVGPLSNWTINLLLNGQQYATTTTDGTGAFSFSDLLPGSYTLAEVLQNGWTQIYSPSGVSLTAGQTSTANNFGNFENATISGYKFNDLNGNHQWDNGEPGLQGWTITLYDNGGSGALLNHQVAQTTTAADGSYSFSNLSPNNYKTCETLQTNWNQTYPTTNGGCNLVTVALSGHNYSGNNFGNQGQGTITVVKNVDTDGNGTVDQQDVTNWTWGYSGTYGSGSNLATGSSNHQSVAAGAYTVSENQKTDYHVSASSCTNEADTSVSTSKAVTVSPGEDVVCTFTNTRDTGTVTVIKSLNPASDPGKFDLSISGATNYTATNQGNGGTTGTQSVLTGLYSVSESGGTGTSLSNYESSYVCKDGEVTVASGDATQSTLFNVGYGDNIVCTFTNERHATITVIKNVDDGFGNVTKDVSTWTWGYDGNSYADDLTTGSTNSQEVTAGDYAIWENQKDNYHFTSVSCVNDEGAVSVTQSESFDTTLSPGDNLVCTFTNTRDTGTITVYKDLRPSNDPGLFNLQINGHSYATNVGDGGNTGAVTVVTGDDYSVSETAGTNTSLDSYNTRWYCYDYNEESYISGTGTTSDSFSVSNGDDIVCVFVNTRLGTINGVKYNDLNGNGKQDAGEPNLSGWTIQLYQQQLSITNLNINGQTPIKTAVTDANGAYQFDNLQDGDYTVCEVLKTGWVQTQPGTTNGCEDVVINLDVEEGQPGQIETVDFGNFQNGTISGFKFDDINGNATFDTGDIKLKNWTINLMQNGKVIATTTTDASGNYSFTNVAAGKYQVCEVQQDGFTRTFPVNSDCQDVTIDTSGQTVTALFGNKEKGEVLGATTLVNTGQPIEYSIIAGLGILTAIGAVSFFTRRQNS